ncbi:MAG: hypothetical protein QMD22_06370 [archaeon]|nr:hypothetical protein [archaeon]
MRGEETEAERRRRWIEREAAKKQPKTVLCSKCGKEVDEYMEIAGRVLCVDCFLLEEMEERGAMRMPGEGGGGG